MSRIAIPSSFQSSSLRRREFVPNGRRSWRNGPRIGVSTEFKKVTVEGDLTARSPVAEEDVGLLLNKPGEMIELVTELNHSQAVELSYSAKAVLDGTSRLPSSLCVLAACGGRVWELRGVFYYLRVNDREVGSRDTSNLLRSIPSYRVERELEKSISSLGSQVSNTIEEIGLQINLSDGVVFSKRKWCMAVPSHEGKTTLVGKYPELFIDHDLAMMGSMTVTNKLRVSVGLSEQSSSVMVTEESKVTLVQIPQMCPKDAVFLGSFLLCNCKLSHPHRGGGSSATVTPGRMNNIYRQINMRYDEKVIYCAGHDMRDIVMFRELLKVGCVLPSVKKGAAGLFKRS